jgi:hypothetical protein
MNEETREIPFGEANSRLSEYYVLLFLILLSGFLLRIWGIWNIDGQDEYNEIFEALRVCSGHLNIERWAKRFYLYVLAFAYGVYYVIGWVFQVFHAPMDFATRIVRNMQPLFLIGRSISVIFGTASLFMTYLIGKSLFNRGVGLIAALFLCLNVINIKLSHYAMVDATLCFTVLVSFYFISRIHSDDGTHLKYYLLAGLFSGIALQNKVPAIILTIPFLLSHVFRSAGKKPLQYIFSKGLAYYCSSFLVGMILGNPAILLAPHKYLKSFLGLAKVFTVPINVTPSQDIGYIFYLKYFYGELGIVLSILAVYSFVRALVSGRREEILILSFIIPFFIVVGGSKFLPCPAHR